MPTEYMTFEEVCETLAKSPAEIKAYVADGRLQELRDAGKIFFKRSQIETLASKEGSSIVELGAIDEEGPEEDKDTFASALTSLSDSSSSLGVLDSSPGTPAPIDLGEPDPAGSSIVLSPADSGLGAMDLADFPEDLPAAPQTETELTSEIDLLGDDSGDTKPAPKAGAAPAKGGFSSPSEVPDLGLSGSSIISLETGLDEVATPKPPQSKQPPAQPKAKGISVFDDDEIEISSDPAGETRISAGVTDFDGVGSGSGLLDLTQEKDDTSLGAELLDVISPTEASETVTEGDSGLIEAAETVEDSGGTVTLEETQPVAHTMPAAAVVMRPVMVGVSPGSVPLNVCAGLGLLGLVMIGLVTAGQLQGVWPSFMTMIATSIVHWSVFGGLALIAIVLGLMGILMGRK